jgi:hypothetical protein
VRYSSIVLLCTHHLAYQRGMFLLRLPMRVRMDGLFWTCWETHALMVSPCLGMMRLAWSVCLAHASPSSGGETSLVDQHMCIVQQLNDIPTIRTRRGKEASTGQKLLL